MNQKKVNYYNDNDSFIVAWLRELIKHGQIGNGFVDERSITEIGSTDFGKYSRCHFFAGIAGWELALNFAGWPPEIPVWTGSCPCQPFSAAGKRQADEDERHFWPAWFRLIKICRPPVILGEQVPGAIGIGWLDRVFDDLEEEGYTCGAVVLPACSVGAPHIRQRIWWVAYTSGKRGQQICGCSSCDEKAHGNQRWITCESNSDYIASGNGENSRLAVPNGGNAEGGAVQRSGKYRQQQEDNCIDGGMADPQNSEWRREGRENYIGRRIKETGRSGIESGMGNAIGIRRLPLWVNRAFAEKIYAFEGQKVGTGDDVLSEFWSDSQWIYCKDAKYRRIPAKPSLFPLSPRLPGRVGILRGAGNSIVPQVAAVFIKAVREFMDKKK